MRHQKRGRKLNRTASHRRALMRNLASSLIIHKRIQTTDAKAKELRTFVEPLITYAKQGTLHARRQVTKALPGVQGKQVAAILFDEIAPQMADRPGGYTRIIKLGNRSNDRAPVSMIELVDVESAEEVEEKPKSEKKSKAEKKEKP
jgi:large subunit ribosomal protein L17